MSIGTKIGDLERRNVVNICRGTARRQRYKFLADSLILRLNAQYLPIAIVLI